MLPIFSNADLGQAKPAVYGYNDHIEFCFFAVFLTETHSLLLRDIKRFKSRLNMTETSINSDLIAIRSLKNVRNIGAIWVANAAQYPLNAVTKRYRGGVRNGF